MVKYKYNYILFKKTDIFFALIQNIIWKLWYLEINITFRALCQDPYCHIIVVFHSQMQWGTFVVTVLYIRIKAFL